MSLSKQQLMGAVGAGLFVVLAGGMGYLLWDAMSRRMEAEEELADQMAVFQRYNAAAVFPSKKSIADIQSNQVSLAAWRQTALDLAARGDKVLNPETPSIFKQRLQAEVRRLAALPGGVEGKICAPAFSFGFEQYLGEGGVLPSPDEVGRLATQLDLIAHVADMFADAGVFEIKSIQRIAATKAPEEEPAAKPKKRVRKNAEDENEASKTTCLEYAFEFAARPAALVTVLNRLTADTRFVVIRKFTFSAAADQIVDRLAAAEAIEAGKNAPASATPRRRRRGAAADEAKPDAPKKVDRLVSDPEQDAPILVGMTLAVYDFGRGTAAAAKAADAGDEGAKVSAPVEKKEEK
ncbi:MAG: hypothetical protein ACI4Q3_09320 [Kiritimatiellia bacterium]